MVLYSGCDNRLGEMVFYLRQQFRERGYRNEFINCIRGTSNLLTKIDYGLGGFVRRIAVHGYSPGRPR